MPHQPTQETIHDLLVKNVPREVVMGVEDALAVGAQRAYVAARGMDEGHLPHVVGQLRHFHMNEAFQRALAANGAEPSPIRGNRIVTGRTGVFTLARFNIPIGFWINGRRSRTRKQLSLANMAIEPLIQSELFSGYRPPSDAVAFFVACFSGDLNIQPESPVSIQIAIPDQHMRGWLFKEPLEAFAKRYDQMPVGQNDLAVPKLKKNIGNQQDKYGTGS
ncbi:alpha/beta hydrolase [Verminephrobacter aporrectodeae]|uniref:alpha/beta hydrolase n=1 Tax=Verminephrobacter aporrectodeae TaxID=1110389 RepID=UPI002244A105|nr:alpha/beta hydrolase [Verminephrobacter aporrectodeae]